VSNSLRTASGSGSDGTALTATSVRKNFDAIVHTLTGAKAPLAASYPAGYTGTTRADGDILCTNFGLDGRVVSDLKFEASTRLQFFDTWVRRG